MFTGLIEEVGTIRSLSKTNRIVINCGKLARELKPGDSVSVNGVCLTALDITTNSFQADLAQETVTRTSLAHLRPGSLVNLELPAKAGAPLGGHIVQGHVDGTAKLLSLERLSQTKDGDWKLVVELPAGLEKYVVEKGSVTIEGISLTVANIQRRKLTVAIIPHTYEVTNLKSLVPGDLLNIEVDVMAKYAEKISQAESKSSGITIERLIAEGI
jgi:riboflavin synthase